MNLNKSCILLLLSVLLEVTNVFAQQDLRLWYQQPAKIWTDALPVGNGRLGAMVYGRATEELLHLNEKTLW